MSSNCSCNNWLTSYTIFYVSHPESYVNHDYIKATGVMIDQPSAKDRILYHHQIEDMKDIQAFTWAEVQRYVEFTQGDDDRKPIHRLIVGGKVWQECQANDVSLNWMYQKGASE